MKRRRRRLLWDLRRRLCGRGIHWPIVHSDSAYPASYDPPEPPEPGWCCDWCGHVRPPYSWWWLEHTTWRIHAAWFEWRERRRAPELHEWPCSGPGWPD